MGEKNINSIPWCESSLKEMNRNLTLVPIHAIQVFKECKSRPQKLEGEKGTWEREESK
jgi:hypothetical protein